MKCSDVQNLISEYLDDATDALTSLQMETHFAICSDCANELSRFKLILQVSSEIEEIIPPIGLKQQISSALDANQTIARNCDGFMQLLSSYADDQLSSDEMNAVGEHISECEHCNEALISIRKIKDTLILLKNEDPPENLRKRILDSTTDNIGFEATFFNWLQTIRSGKCLRRASTLLAAGIVVVGVIAISPSSLYEPNGYTANLTLKNSHSVHENVNTSQKAKIAVVSKVPEEGILLSSRQTNIGHNQNKVRSKSNVSVIKVAQSIATRPIIHTKLETIDNNDVSDNSDESDKNNLTVTDANNKIDIKTDNNNEVKDQNKNLKQKEKEAIEIASAPALAGDNPEEWMKEVKAEAALHKSNKNSEFKVFSTKF